jgi:glycine/D-amino acid oxidase-like deaminating enzyme
VEGQEAVHRAGSEAYTKDLLSRGVPSPPPELDWVIPRRICSYEEVGNPGNTGQVHPYLFTTTMAKLAEDEGAEIILGSAISIDYTGDGAAVRSVTYRSKDIAKIDTLPATDVIIAAGPWTPTLLPSAPIGGSRSHSIVIRPSKFLSAYVLFFSQGSCDISDNFMKLEIYPRPDDTVYACGPTDHDVPLPPTSDEVKVDDKRCMDIRHAADSISKELKDGKLLVQQACYRPVVNVAGRSRGTGPLLGPTGARGLLLASGHDEWGIQNGPITGKVISEIIFDGKALSVDIRSLDPREVLKKPD